MDREMDRKDKIVRALFVALAVGLGWGIRGNFGHQLGAAVPGAALAMSFAFVSGQRSLFRLMPIFGALGALTIMLGGSMSYGILHGYAKSDTLINYSYGFFTLILQGGTWGGFGGGALGLLMEDERPKLKDWIFLAAFMYLCGFVVYTLIVRVAGFHINPPRSDLSIGFFGAMAGIFFWLRWKRKFYALKGALYAFLGFGVGMAFARLLANVAHNLPITYDQWKVMEIGTGFFGGFVFAYAMLGKEVKAFAEKRLFSVLSYVSIIGVMAGLPILHRLRRVTPASLLNDVTLTFAGKPDINPAAFSANLMTALYVILGLSVLGAVLWAMLHKKDQFSWSAFPSLALMGLMLLVDNIKSLFPFTPAGQGSFRVEATFWFFYLLMIFIAVRLKPGLQTVQISTWNKEIHWKKVMLWALGVYIFMIIAAGFINGPKTMTSANTRWPIWSWHDGPAPK